MNSFNTIEVAQLPSAAQHSSAGNSEQHGLMGVGASANLKDDFFDDDKDAIKNRKPKITDAIEDADTRKKIVVKKKKKKGTKV